MSKEVKTLRSIREKQFKTITAFCAEFKKQTGEKLPEGTMSLYENGMRMSSRRLDLIAQVLQISSLKKNQLEKEMGGDLRYCKQHDEHKMTKIRKPRKEKKENQNKVTVSISPKVAAHKTVSRPKRKRVSDTTRYRRLLKVLGGSGDVDVANKQIKLLAFQMALVD